MFPEDLQKNAEIDIQELTDKFISRVDSIFNSKEKEILTLQNKDLSLNMS